MTKKTVGEQFFADPRIAEAKKLITDALKEHSQKISGPKAADPELKSSYEELLKSFAQDRGGALWYKYLGTGVGKGALVELADGSVKYDFITGIGVHFFGHSHPGVVEAQVQGAISNTTMSGNLQQNVDSPKLFNLLIKEANKYGAKLEHMFMTSSGAMAAENSLKMAFQKRFPAHRVLAFEKCFMGRTIAVSQITDKAQYRQGVPQTLSVDYLPFYDPKDHKGSIDKALYTLKKHLTRYPGQYAAMCAELVQGEGGYYVGHTEFFKAIFDECKKNNISVIIDEVQTFGRTSELFAFQYFKLDEYVDFVNIGKNSQVCATLFKADHKPQAGLISQTFTSSGSAISAAYYIINEIVKGGFLGPDGKNEKFHHKFKSNLEKLAQKYPDKIEGPWGLGAMVGMTVFKGDADKTKDFSFKLYDNGVLSFMAGAAPTRLRFLMPVGAVTEKDIDEVCTLIEKTLTEVK